MKAIKQHATKPLDVHLMIVDPDRYITAFKKAGADILTVHYEACNHLHRTCSGDKGRGNESWGCIKSSHTCSGIEGCNRGSWIWCA